MTAYEDSEQLKVYPWDRNSGHYPTKPPLYQMKPGAVNPVMEGENNEEQRKSCCSCFSQCSQETSFSGIKYIGGKDSGAVRR